ncbi:MAG: hypothetical protein HUU28_08065 [Planctomycetaceae bacterium]|nr:hypothetical protein [Planctomycetaceae bacterium]
MKNWETAKFVIVAAREAGLRLRAVGGELRVKPEALLTPGLRLQLRFLKAEILEILEYHQRQAAARRAASAVPSVGSSVAVRQSKAPCDVQEPAAPAGDVEPEPVVEAASGEMVANGDATPAAPDRVPDLVPDITPDSAPALDQQPEFDSESEPTPATRPDRDPPWPRGPQHCITCWGTRFVDLRDGRRWACFTCTAPEAGDVVAECDNGPQRGKPTGAPR